MTLPMLTTPTLSIQNTSTQSEVPKPSERIWGSSYNTSEIGGQMAEFADEAKSLVRN